MKKILFKSISCALFVLGCADSTLAACDTSSSCVPTAVVAPTCPPTRAQERHGEIVVKDIPLSGDVKNNKAELSGLAWYKDYLILLPQFPDFPGAAGAGGARLFAIKKGDLVDYLDGRKSPPLDIKEIRFSAVGVTSSIKKKLGCNGNEVYRDCKPYEGFEAIAFQGDRVYMTIETTTTQGGMMGYLVSGTINPDLSEVHLDADVWIELKPPANVKNAAYESLMLMSDRLLSLYEGNGVKINPSPEALVFSLPKLKELQPISFPNIEYRITDATEADSDGKFWAINYFYPGKRESEAYKTGEDAIAKKFGKGATHCTYPQVERLVEFQYTENRIVLTNTPPIQLSLEKKPRNWEGLVRLDKCGFLIVTDEYPETMLGFVAYP